MKVRNASDQGRVIAATGQDVPPGGEVDVDDEIGESLCQQEIWQPVTTKPQAAEPDTEETK